MLENNIKLPFIFHVTYEKPRENLEPWNWRYQNFVCLVGCIGKKFCIFGREFFTKIIFFLNRCKQCGEDLLVLGSKKVRFLKMFSMM